MHLSSRFVVSTFSLARSLYSQAYGTVLRTRQILFAGIPDSTCFVPFVCFVRWLVRLVRWTRFARLRLHTRAVVAYAQRTALSHARARTPYSVYTSSLVLYNAAIDSRPLFHARDLLQSLQPVSGDSVQCPVSLPVSVHKIYFPMRYTGWHREKWTWFVDYGEKSHAIFLLSS